MKARIAFIIFFVVLTSPFLLNAASGNMLQTAEAPALEKASGTQCVEDTAYMRLNHMNILKTEREQAVRYGIRTTKHSLQNCFTCHKHKTQFCDKCHQFAGVAPSCFSTQGGCHYAPQ